MYDLKLRDWLIELLIYKNIRKWGVVLLAPKIVDHLLNPIPNLPLIPGQIKVSNLTPGTRSPCWMGAGEGWERIEGLSQPN